MAFEIDESDPFDEREPLTPSTVNFGDDDPVVSPTMNFGGDDQIVFPAAASASAPMPSAPAIKFGAQDLVVSSPKGMGVESSPTLMATTPQQETADQPTSSLPPAARAPRRAGIPGIIDNAAAEYGLDPQVFARFAEIESGGNPRAVTGSYRGLFQLGPEEWRRYGGGGNIFDPAHNARAAAAKMADEREAFANQFGRYPDPYELYLIHQQGPAGYAAHAGNPDAPAWENMYATGEGRQKGPRWARQAIWGNIPDQDKRRFGSVDNVSSRDFIDLWRRRVEGNNYARDPFEPDYDPEELLRKVFSAPPEERGNIIDEELHRLLGVPVDDRGPVGSIGLARPIQGYPPFSEQEGFGAQAPVPRGRPPEAPAAPPKPIVFGKDDPIINPVEERKKLQQKLQQRQREEREKPLPGSAFDYVREALFGAGDKTKEQVAAPTPATPPVTFGERDKIVSPLPPQDQQQAASAEIPLPRARPPGAPNAGEQPPGLAEFQATTEANLKAATAEREAAQRRLDEARSASDEQASYGSPQILRQALARAQKREQMAADAHEAAKRGEIPPAGALDTAGMVGQQIFDAAVYHLPGALAAALEGADPYETRDWKDWLVERSRQRSKEQDAALKSRETTAIPGVSGKDIASLGPSLGFSGVAGLAGAGAGLGAAAAGAPLGPLASGAAGWTAGGAASGVAAYRMSTNQIARDLREAADEASVKATGKPLSDAEFIKKSADLMPLIREYGLWEAIPEAAGNVAGLGIITAPVKGAIGRLFGQGVLTRFVSKVGAHQAVEVGTEAITQQGQHNIEVRAKLSDAAERSWRSPTDFWESMKEVAVPTILQTAIMGGAAKSVQILHDRIVRGGMTPEQYQFFMELNDRVERGQFDPETARTEAIRRLSPNQATTGAPGEYPNQPISDRPPVAQQPAGAPAAAASQPAPAPASAAEAERAPLAAPPQPDAEAAPAPPTAAVTPPEAPTSPSQGEVSPRDRAILRAFGLTNKAINRMSPEERQANVDEALASKIKVPEEAQPTFVEPEIAPDQPTAEPTKDLLAQADDLRAPDNPRQAVWLPKTSLDNLNKDSESAKRVLGSGVVLKDFDGSGGTLVAKDKATADAARAERDRIAALPEAERNAPMQALIGGLTGAGVGKPADATAVVQQVTPEGAVARETAVSPGEAAQTETDSAIPGRDVRTVTPEAALRRREDEIAAEKDLGAAFDAAVEDQFGKRDAPHKVATPEDMAQVGGVVEQPKSQAPAGQPPQESEAAPLSRDQAQANLERAKSRARDLQRRLDAVDRRLEEPPPKPRNALDKERLARNRSILERNARSLRKKVAEAFDAVDDARKALKSAEAQPKSQKKEEVAQKSTPQPEPPRAAVSSEDLDIPDFLQRKKETARVEETSPAEVTEAAKAAEGSQVPVPAEDVSALATGEKKGRKTGEEREKAGAAQPPRTAEAPETGPSDSEADARWWNNDLTTAGRSDIIKGLGLKLGPRTLWRHIDDETKQVLLSRKPSDRKPDYFKGEQPVEPDYSFTPPDGWRENIIKARVYANALKLDHKDLNLTDLVAAINKKLGKAATEEVERERSAKAVPEKSAEPSADVASLPKRVTLPYLEKLASRAASMPAEEKQRVEQWLDSEFDRLERDGKKIERTCLGRGKKFSIR